MDSWQKPTLPSFPAVLTFKTQPHNVNVFSSFVDTPLSISCEASDCFSDRPPLKIAPLQGQPRHISREEKWIGMGWCAVGFQSSCQFGSLARVGGSSKRDTVQMLGNAQDRYNIGALLKKKGKKGKKMTPYTFSHPFTVITCVHVHLMSYISSRRQRSASCRDRWLTHYRIFHFYWHVLSRNISSIGIGSLAKVTHLSWKGRKRERGGEGGEYEILLAVLHEMAMLKFYWVSISDQEPTRFSIHVQGY